MATKKYRLRFDHKAQTWKMRKRYRGKEHNFDCETANERVAIGRADRELERLIASAFGERPQKTLKQAIGRFIEQSGHLKHTTRERYGSALAHVLDALGVKELMALTRADIDRYIQARRQHVSPATIGFEIKMLATVLDMCRVWEWCEKNVARDYRLELSKKRSDVMKRNRRTRYLTHEEEARLLKAAFARYYPHAWRIVLAIETGLRQSEQFSLELTDVDFQRERIRVRAELPGNKSARERWVPLTHRAQDAIQRLHEGSKWVCPREDGKRFALGSSKPLEALKELAKIAGIEDLRWHDLRRTCGCRLLQDRGFRLEDVQVWLGHASISETEGSYAFLKIEHVHARLRESTSRLLIEHVEKDNGET